MKSCDSNFRRLCLWSLITINGVRDNDARRSLCLDNTMGIFHPASRNFISLTIRWLHHVSATFHFDLEGFTGERRLVVANIPRNVPAAFLLSSKGPFLANAEGWVRAICHSCPRQKCPHNVTLPHWERTLMEDWHAHSLTSELDRTALSKMMKCSGAEVFYSEEAWPSARATFFGLLHFPTMNTCWSQSIQRATRKDEASQPSCGIIYFFSVC